MALMDVNRRDTKLGCEPCGLCGAVYHAIETFDLYELRVCADCRAALSQRRQAAFAIDCILFVVAGCAVQFMYFGAAGSWKMPGWVVLPFVALFFLKDGFRGMSPGKWLLGVQVLDEVTLRPAGFRASCQRNLVFLLNWIAMIVVLGDVAKGRRWGDRWAGTVVIWRRYADRMPCNRSFTLCRRCGYDLTGNASGICPECSTAIPGFDQQAIASKGLPSASTHDD